MAGSECLKGYKGFEPREPETEHREKEDGCGGGQETTSTSIKSATTDGNPHGPSTTRASRSLNDLKHFARLLKFPSMSS